MNHLNLIAVLSRPLFLCLSADFSPQTSEISFIMQRVEYDSFVFTCCISLYKRTGFSVSDWRVTQESFPFLFLSFSHWYSDGVQKSRYRTGEYDRRSTLYQFFIYHWHTYLGYLEKIRQAFLTINKQHALHKQRKTKIACIGFTSAAAVCVLSNWVC